MEIEGIFEVAKAHYANLSETEKREVRNRFNKIDSDGDGVVSRRDYKNYITKGGYKIDAFDVLDKNGDGKMDFDEFITFDFIYNVRGYTSCSGCDVPLFGFYFVCVKCHDNSKTYHLCCKCYGDKSYKHVDGHTDFRDMHSLVQIKKSTPAPASQSMMDDLVKTAELYYNVSSSEVKKAATKFFDELDHNKDEKVSLQEFLRFMRQQGHTQMSNRHFFKQIDRNDSGLLEFNEVMAVYYIIKSGRPFCVGCEDFIPGMYFTCSKCFGNGSNVFCVCPKCFEDGRYNHEHNYFMDNYALLEAKRLQGNATFSNQQKPSSPVVLPTSTTNATNTLVPYRPQREHLGFKKFEVALTAAQVALTALEIAIAAAAIGAMGPSRVENSRGSDESV